MFNKNLEKILSSPKYSKILRLLQKVENGEIKVLGIKFNENMDITGNKVLDKQIIEFFRKFKIRIINDEISNEDYKEQQNQCKHLSHNLYNKKLTHSKNVDNFISKNIALFKLDATAKNSYAICPKCTNIISIA